ncbi:glucose PTS transporter transcription antiterminator GlcT [Clostridium folliculivorans]|uniref:glucose PTS transporter transcription antiterminator GlcT n=1 Tax=Clostridium folliculivorans TaxID=2886038 RepID=UPI0021C2E2B1|nr:PRD domain-containing protein [Clostridium folliculivorans]GKU31601.1 transcription antiterminator BglG [Clostridium folliculivorans]
MVKKLNCDWSVIKAFNNNIVLATNNKSEKILFAKGIGFNKKLGDIITSETLVEKIFTIEDEKNKSNFKEIVNRNDEAFVALCEEIIRDISDKLGEELSENIHVGLIDHIDFAVKRLKNSEEIQNPFISEIQTLYDLEFDLAKSASLRLEKELGVKIPDGEVGFIALHIHSARKNGKLSNTMKYSFINNSIVEFIEEELNLKIDRKSLDYARFITHVRFACERIVTNKTIKNELKDTIKRRYKQSYKLAKEAAKVIEDQLEAEVTIDEVAYLAIHIERLKNL